MASQGSGDHTPQDSGDKPYPAANMLRPFRVRSIRPAGSDGVIRMKRDEYDDLLTRQPRAALSYFDESDGEVILVGSSLELDERLQEPVENSPVTNAGVTLDLYGIGSRRMHVFEVEKETSVVEAWQGLDQRTTAEGQRAKEVFFGRSSAAVPQDKGKQKADVRFGQVSPPRGALKVAPPVPPKNPHASRWASYSNLPSSFDHEPVPVTTEDAVEATETAPLLPPSPPPKTNDVPTLPQSDTTLAPGSAFNVTADAANAPVRSSTLQVPTTPKQTAEYQPLIDMFFTEQNTAQTEPASNSPKEEQKQYQPLLDLFEGQLAELAGPSHAADKPSESEKPEEATSSKGPFAQKSGELLHQSIQSLLNGVGLLAATFKKTNSELQQQIALAQQDFPNNIEKALKASVAAIESLRSMIPAANVDTNPETPDSSPTEQQRQPFRNVPNDAQRNPTIEPKIRMYRYKLQKHILQSKMHPTHDELLMLNEILKDLEIAWKGLSADVLLKTKIHKVLKRINRMEVVPGDDEFSFKNRSGDLAANWMKTIEAYRQGERNKANSNPRNQPAAANKDTEDAASREMPAAETKSESDSATVVQAEKAKENRLDESPLENHDDQVYRVEQATELMRRQLLDMGLLPPAERPIGGMYTRADVLEAYIRKFNALKELTGETSSSRSNEQEAKAISDAGLQQSGEAYYSNQQAEGDTQPYASASEQAQGEEEKKPTLPERPEPAPRKAVSFDNLGRQVGEPARPASLREQVLSNTVTPRTRPIAYPAINVPSTNRGWAQVVAGTHPVPYGTHPVPHNTPLRHRQSWHPSSTAVPAQDERYPFSFSPQDVMARYPPISQINRNSPWPTYQPSPAVDASSQTPRSGSQPGPRGTPSAPRGTPAWQQTNSASTQRSASTLVTRAELERRRAERRQQYTERPARQRNGRPDNAEAMSAAQQGEQAAQNDAVQKCIEQLTKMGFAYGRADAVANAVLGNLEMALDVLNEDSAAWEAKAKEEERRETGREREEVPGSWGSWDDELYG